MNIKFLLLFPIFFISIFKACSQTSFRISSEYYYDNSNIHEYDNGDIIFLSSIGKSALYNPSAIHSFPVLSKININGELIWSKTSESSTHPPTEPMQFHNFSVSESNAIYSNFSMITENFGEVSGIVKSSQNGDFSWFTEIPRPSISLNSSIFSKENIPTEEIFTFFSHNLKLGFAKLNTSGDLIQNYGARILRDQNQLDIFTQYEDLIKSSQGDFYACGSFGEEGALTYQSGFIHKVDQSGETVSISTIENFLITTIKEDSNNNLILSGFLNQNENNYYPGLIILDSNGNFLTSKIFLSEEFESREITFDLDAYGNFIVFFQKWGNDFSSIIKLDEDFNPIWTRVYPGGYNGINPIIKVTSDQGIVFFTGITNSDTNVQRTVISKIDSLGNFPNIDAPEFCYQDPIEIIIEINEENFSIQPLDFLENQSFDLVNQNQKIALEEPPIINYPTPSFSLPDILCANQCSAPTNLQNEYADSQVWHTQGAETELHESKNPGQLCWDIPGTYQVQQIISFQNCLDTFEQFITVVPEIEIILPDTLTFCPNDEISIDGYSENALNYLWSTGETSALIEPTQPGLYIISADNQFCSTVDSVFVQMTTMNYDSLPIGLPQDTILCEANLPFDIFVDLPYSEVGNWEDGSDENPRTIYNWGNFTFMTEVGGCAFSETIRVNEKDCRARIYIPTAFSPNDDGINDIFEPQGSGFDVLDFSIYNRWGALVFQSNTSSWDGKFKGQRLDADVFVYIMEWVNIETGETGIEKGSIQLLH